MIHKGLTQERWFKFSLFEQLANVGMDIERTIQWKNKENQEYSQQAFERALELLDLTIADPKNNQGKRKELLRVREALIDYLCMIMNMLQPASYGKVISMILHLLVLLLEVDSFKYEY